MGYSNERASLNQFSELYTYCQENVMAQIKTVFNKTLENEKNFLEKELPFVYESLNQEDKIPVVSFDGGIATIFLGELAETKIIKVAGAAPPKWKDYFVGIQSSLFHVCSGLLKWPQGIGITQEEAIIITIEESLKNEVLLELFDHLGISIENYKDSMTSHLKYKQGNQVEDCFREILEWALIINFCERQKNNKNIDNKQKIPYLIVKDGSLYPFGKTVGDLLSKEIEKYLNAGECSIVGMVKASRFVAEDSSYRKSINKYLKGINKNTFFKLPKKLEMTIDHRSYFYERYFFSMFGGKSIYEIQIPIVNMQIDKNYITMMMDIINSQVTFNFGGSISTNSYAHIEASLSESESRLLTEKLKTEILKELHQKKGEEK